MKLVVEEKSNKKYLISLNNKSKSLNIVLINKISNKIKELIMRNKMNR